MTFDQAMVVHMGLGTVGLGLFWAGLGARKGGPRHRVSGRAFFVVLLGVAVSVAPLIFLRPVPFDPGQVVQFVYLSLCLGTVTTVAWTAIRWKADVAAFRGWHFRVLGPLLLGLGAVVLAAGTAKGDPVAAVLSWVGLAYGAAMIHFAWTRALLQPRWWLTWHLHAVCGLFTAVHGTLLFVAWRRFVDVDATRADAAAFHAGVLLVALALRAWLGRRHGVPWTFTQPGARVVPQA
ncbi:MAG: hypothetical protein H6932_05690 [Burkholderiaceae bacterium]|nr:hypothetical protein [Burkholderiaceae bacterium]